VLGTSKDLKQGYSRANDGAKVGLSLGQGWEPHWTYAEIDHATHGTLISQAPTMLG
jgi:hypothetical protein